MHQNWRLLKGLPGDAARGTPSHQSDKMNNDYQQPYETESINSFESSINLSEIIPITQNFDIVDNLLDEKIIKLIKNSKIQIKFNLSNLNQANKTEIIKLLDNFKKIQDENKELKTDLEIIKKYEIIKKKYRKTNKKCSLL